MTDELTAAALVRQYGAWGNHPDYPAAEWRREVANEDTRLGYWQWVEHLAIAVEAAAKAGVAG